MPASSHVPRAVSLALFGGVIGSGFAVAYIAPRYFAAKHSAGAYRACDSRRQSFTPCYTCCRVMPPPITRL